MMLERGRRPHPSQRPVQPQRPAPSQRAPLSQRAMPRRGLSRRWCMRLWCLGAGIMLSSRFSLWLGFALSTGGAFRNPFWKEIEGLGRAQTEEDPKTPVITYGTMGTIHSVRENGAGRSGLNDTRENLGMSPGSLVTPAQWDSSLCMEHWGRKELLTEPDPNGYIIFVSGAEQLGGNKYLLTDGLFAAKILDRTLVEYPAKDARISGANATMGLGAYWDLSTMCMNHRILDIRAFRRLVERGLIPPEEFVTIETGLQPIVTRHFKNSASVRAFYEGKIQYKVIVMEHTWKSHLNRRAMAYLRPNPFFFGVVRMLLVDHEDFAHGNFLAVQWRTETATGDMAQCYDEVRATIEEQRRLVGLRRDQVLISTDMYGSTSGTYSPKRQRAVGAETIRRIKQDYPKALDNRLHDFFNRIQDTGIKAIVSGLVMAQARVLLASSLNSPSSKDSLEATVCQKPFSGYIQLITEWRTKLFGKDPSTVVRMFPFGDPLVSPMVTSTDSDNIGEPDVEGAKIEVKEEKKKKWGEEQGGGGGVKEEVVAVV